MKQNNRSQTAMQATTRESVDFMLITFRPPIENGSQYKSGTLDYVENGSQLPNGNPLSIKLDRF
jgi:hypothetical protein